jgi:hypothetical protein
MMPANGTYGGQGKAVAVNLSAALLSMVTAIRGASFLASWRSSAGRLLLVIDVGKFLAPAVHHDVGGAGVLDRPWRREAAGFRLAIDPD